MAAESDLAASLSSMHCSFLLLSVIYIACFLCLLFWWGYGSRFSIGVIMNSITSILSVEKLWFAMTHSWRLMFQTVDLCFSFSISVSLCPAYCYFFLSFVFLPLFLNCKQYKENLGQYEVNCIICFIYFFPHEEKMKRINKSRQRARTQQIIFKKSTKEMNTMGCIVSKLHNKST